MIATFWLAGALACARVAPAPAPIPGRIVEVTVYPGRAMVTREVPVPPGEGTIELVVAPLPERTMEDSLSAEPSAGLRVLSTRYRTRPVGEGPRPEVRQLEDQLARLAAEAGRLRKEIAVRQDDLRYVQKLEGFTGATLNGLTEKGRLDVEAIVALSRFVMETRSTKSKETTDLEAQLSANAEAADLARRQLGEQSAGKVRTEREAVIVVQRTGGAQGVIRLGYLVDAATWMPHYRVRADKEPASPVRLEYLAAVVQQTGEPWEGVRVTLSNAPPTLDAAPPAIRPLEIVVDGTVDAGPIEASDDQSQRLAAVLARPIPLAFPNETPLSDFVKSIRGATRGPAFPESLPIYVDPLGLQEAERSMNSTITIDVSQVPLRTSLALALEQLGLTYRVRDGLLTITSIVDRAENDPKPATVSDPGPLLAQTGSEGAGPGVTFPIKGRLDIPSRPDPQWLEIARLELPAEHYARAVPVISTEVHRLARLTNRSGLVLLPGEATVHVDADFAGRMRLPTVAAGESFVVGLGADPQLQVARRLVSKTRAVQGGNQMIDYEFRIGLRNYRSTPVKVELWDRMPKPRSEAVAVNLVKTSAELSADPLYQRTARSDNLLRWEIPVPGGTIGEKTLYVTYQFRLEYARDLAPPRFVSGGLAEKPIGGGAMGTGSMMGGGMRSIAPRAD